MTNRKIDVLDKGFIRLVDHMGGDLSISRNARVSYDAEWRAGKDEGSDAKLINYLYKNHHNTPFEAVTVTFDIKAPIFVIRQWHRHRTQCLSGSSRLKFARPCDGKPYWKTIKEIYNQWNTEEIKVKRPDRQKRSVREFKRDTIKKMKLYCVEDGEKIATTGIVDCWQSGEKEVYEIETYCGKRIKASADHRFLTPEGWKILSDLKTDGEILSVLQKAVTANKPFISYSNTELSNEEWKITEYLFVTVSNLGRVKRRGKIVEPTLNSSGRFVVSVKQKDGKWKTVHVSKLVATAFLEGVGHVLHEDDCNRNNRVENLRYGTDFDNHQDMNKNGRRKINVVSPIKIKHIKFVNIEMTYDIEVSHKDHNFIAEDFCTHNSYNELSARYRELPEEFYIPDHEQITMQNTDNKQMRTAEQHPEADLMQRMMIESDENCFYVYKKLIDKGCPRELARTVLPVSTYSHMFATMNLHNAMRFMVERLHPHAQYEIRVYAEAMLQLLEPIAPVAMGAFKKGLTK